MENLKYKKKNAWENADKKAIFDFCDGYKAFLNKAKTEREFVKQAILLAQEAGFKPYDAYPSLAPGDRVYFENRGKNLLLCVMGSEPLEKGFHMVGAHMDAPRLDLKQNPLYEDGGLALLRTHYYGGIKKYQWTTIPLAMHGVVVKQDGTKVEIHLGDEGSDMCFTITDLLIHLSSEQMKKTLSTAIEGENLQILCGSIPEFEKDDADVKGAILNLLFSEYGISEEDFASAEIEIVPSFAAKDVGFDRSFVGAYGHDDRVCSYTALKAVFEAKNPKKCAMCLLVDKEEIGSVGDTGMQSRFFENAVASLIAKSGNYSDLLVRSALCNGKCLSADVAAGLDPLYANAHDKQNAPLIGCGVNILKFSGSRGKSGANDASAEFVAEVRRLFNSGGVVWQTGELGKVDFGGGGTIAAFTANLGMETLDVGTALLCMHSPFELASKADIYHTFKAYEVFFK